MIRTQFRKRFKVGMLQRNYDGDFFMANGNPQEVMNFLKGFGWREDTKAPTVKLMGNTDSVLMKSGPVALRITKGNELLFGQDWTVVFV